MEKSSTRDLTSGSPMKLILDFTLPLLLGLLFQQFYNMVDTIVVGQYLGVNALAGVGSTGSISFLVIGFVIGVCSGFAIPVAQKFGSKDFDALRKCVGNTIWIVIFFAAVLTTATCILCSDILTLMHTPDEVFSEAYNYIFVIFLGIPVTFLYNTLSGFIRSLGDSKTPVIFLVISSLLNIVLDIFFIVALNMGVAGAGWATIISQLVSGILCLIYIAKRFEILCPKKEDLKPEAYYIKRLCASGLPMGLQYSITAIGSILLQASVNSLGPTYMASMTAGSKVSQFMCCPLDALGTAMATYGGQNVGAGKVERLNKGLRDCLILGICYSLIALVVALLFGEKLAMLFINQNDVESTASIPEILGLARQFLITNAAFYIPLAFVNIVRFLIQGMGFSQIAVYAGLFELIARALVGVLLVPRFGFAAACFASPLAWILADSFLVPTYFACHKRVKRQLANFERQ